MEFQVTRKTGFYGMGSAIELTKNGQKWLFINHNQTKKLTLSEPEFLLQAKFFFLKSNKLVVKNTGKPVQIELTMNPALGLMYLLFFICFFLMSLLHFSILGSSVVLVCYFVFLFSILNNAYVIKEKLHGTESRDISE